MKAPEIAEKKLPTGGGRKKRGAMSRILLALVTLLAVLITLSFISPLPVSMLIRLAFLNGNAVAPDNYDALQLRVIATKDLMYPSSNKSNLADIYYPREGTAPYPVVLWIHGGAYVGGDKKDVEIFATALAAEGYAVVCINYERAPEAKYPVPVIQTGEAYTWLCGIAAEYSLDMQRLILAGDSAGAQIASQFAAIQMNAAYADEMAMEQLVPQGNIKSLLLYCGPYNKAKMDAIDNVVIRFFLNRAAWAYFGNNGRSEEISTQVTVKNHIFEQFPPTFLTDGNKASFEDHARELAEVLKTKNIPVETYFIDPSAETAYHEYQFVMNNDTGREAFQKTLDFINRYVP